MMRPDSPDVDEILEWAAQLIEDTDLSDIRGVWAKRKREREDAELKLAASKEARAKCAAHVRAMKSRPDLDAKSVLRHLAGLPAVQHRLYLRDAWPLAWKGWVNIECRLKCNGNSSETDFHIALTDKGRAALSEDLQ